MPEVNAPQLSIKIPVEPGATEIDIGPILEPILARLVRLERIGGYNDLTQDERRHLPRGIDNKRFVSLQSVHSWLSFAKADMAWKPALLELDYATVRRYLVSRDWKQQDISYLRSECFEHWQLKHNATPFSGKPSCNERTRVPLDTAPEETRAFFLQELLEALARVNYTLHYERTPLPKILEEIKQSVSPLERLAKQSD